MSMLWCDIQLKFKFAARWQHNKETIFLDQIRFVPTKYEKNDLWKYPGRNLNSFTAGDTDRKRENVIYSCYWIWKLDYQLR